MFQYDEDGIPCATAWGANLDGQSGLDTDGRTLK
jgi:hypothetical protein